MNHESIRFSCFACFNMQIVKSLVSTLKTALHQANHQVTIHLSMNIFAISNIKEKQTKNDIRRQKIWQQM